MDDEFPPLALRNLLLADFFREVDAFDNILERVRVGLLKGGECLVQPICDLLLEFIVDVAPAGFLRDEERPNLLVAALLVRPLLGLLS